MNPDVENVARPVSPNGHRSGQVLTPEQIRAADENHMVHGFSPFTSTPNPQMQRPIFRTGHGIHLTDIDGNDWLDACAGQANVSLGYGRHELADVAGAALRELSFATHFYQSRGHVGAAQLSERLAQHTPSGLDQFFYVVGGSEAVETAIKIARFVNIVNGRPEKVHIIGRWNSYHGVTYGGASLSGDRGMWKNIGPRLPGFSHIDQPVTNSEGAAQALEDEILRVGPDRVAAFMAEPISTPNGIVIPPADYWPQVRAICTKYDVLMICDEVLTGFGRAGKMFAIQNWGVTPDLLTMAKAITAGYFPLAAVAMSSELRQRLSTGGETFVHGVTSGGHPAACAVALATIDIMEREDIVARAAVTGRYLVDQLRNLAERHPTLNVESARGIGMMAAIDMQPGIDPTYGARVQSEFLRQRVLVRGYRDCQTIGLLPALTLTADDVDDVVARMSIALQRTPA